MAKETSKNIGIERERKFLVAKLPQGLSRFPHSLIEQGYLVVTKEDRDPTEIRLRRKGHHYVLTIKKGLGRARLEREIPLPVAHARSLWPLTKGRRIGRVRYEVPCDGLKVEVDVYRGKARGLAVAE